MENFDVIIVGAGPAGTACAAKLSLLGLKVLILEKFNFPRFVIGESHLPQNMELYKECGLDQVFEKNQFQKKDGAEFLRGSLMSHINFKDKSKTGPWCTVQVKREEFDLAVANEVKLLGAEIYFDHVVTNIKFDFDGWNVCCEVLEQKTQISKTIVSQFIVDASGLAKTLPKLLGLQSTYTREHTKAYFTHIKTKELAKFDNDKILITVDEKNEGNWFWTIPLSQNLYSLGLISVDSESETAPQVTLESFVDRNTTFKKLLGNYSYVRDVSCVHSFSSHTHVKHGEHFLIIGNSGEFLDPVFSSGVTIALKSACLAAPLIFRKLQGENIDWPKEYLDPLDRGINTFKAFVNAWYEKDLQKIIFSESADKKIYSYIVSILAGYAWDENNPYTMRSSERLKTLAKLLA